MKRMTFRGISESDVNKLDDLLWGRLLLTEDPDKLDELAEEIKSEGIWHVISYLIDYEDPYRTPFSEIIEILYE